MSNETTRAGLYDIDDQLVLIEDHEPGQRQKRTSVTTIHSVKRHRAGTTWDVILRRRERPDDRHVVRVTTLMSIPGMGPDVQDDPSTVTQAQDPWLAEWRSQSPAQPDTGSEGEHALPVALSTTLTANVDSIVHADGRRTLAVQLYASEYPQPADPDRRDEGLGSSDSPDLLMPAAKRKRVMAPSPPATQPVELGTP